MFMNSQLMFWLSLHRAMDQYKSEFPKEKLAAAGFIFTGTDDIVICTTCNTEGCQWYLFDDPVTYQSTNPQRQSNLFEQICYIQGLAYCSARIVERSSSRDGIKCFYCNFELLNFTWFSSKLHYWLKIVVVLRKSMWIF